MKPTQMTFLQALYGSQYLEISQRGGDVNSGRINGNALLSAFCTLALFILVRCVAWVCPESVWEAVSSWSVFQVFDSGKTIGKVLGILSFGLFYGILTKTIGSEANYQKWTNEFLLLPSTIQDTANRRILIPFGILLFAFILYLFI